MNLADAKAKIESWRQSYNTVRPHGSLNDDTPAEFAGRFEEPLPFALQEDKDDWHERN
jgi:transposase InsO family protein